MQTNNRGFTLVELIVVMAVFITVLAITASAFNTILVQATKLFRSEESNIEGVIGLEMLRHDLTQTGLGLFTEFSPVAYKGEAKNLPASAYNDYNTSASNPGKEPPRPIVTGNDLAAGQTNDDDSSGTTKFVAGTDYLVIKGTTVGRNQTAQKWTYLEYAPPNVIPHAWPSASENFVTNESVVLLKRQVTSSTQTATLVPDGSGVESFYYAYSNVAFNALASGTNAVYTAYGIASRSDNKIRMPFNRADYFVSLPVDASGNPDTTRIPNVCAKDAAGAPHPDVGILYKATIDQDGSASGGKLEYVPLVDCVADMQVVLGWDMDGNGAVDTYSNANGTQCNPCGATVATIQAALSTANNSTSSTVPNIRNNLKMVKVYVLAQDGRRDPGYTSPSPIIVGDNGETTLTRSYDLAAKGLRNYRWKVHRVVVRPKNLPVNQ